MDTKMVHDGAGYFPGVKSTTGQGAAALLRLICAPGLESVTGRYYDGQAEARANEQAYDLESRQRLLQLSKQLCNIS
jgi:hypothetical protein